MESELALTLLELLLVRVIDNNMHGDHEWRIRGIMALWHRGIVAWLH